MEKKSLLAVAVALSFLLLAGSLWWPDEEPTRTHPAPEAPPPPPPEPILLEDPPAGPAVPATAPDPTPPSATLVVCAKGGQLPRTLQILIDGENREQKFPPWADPDERRIPLPGVVEGTRVEVSADGFAGTSLSTTRTIAPPSLPDNMSGVSSATSLPSLMMMMKDEGS